MLARAAASIDLLSGARFELGIGAGRVSDAIEAMGGPRRTPGESLEALEEAFTIIGRSGLRRNKALSSWTGSTTRAWGRRGLRYRIGRSCSAPVSRR
jgi:hypothetical protein